MKKLKTLIYLLFAFQFSCNAQEYKLIGGFCEGCEAVFEYGNKELKSIDTLPEFEANSPKLKVSGTIFENDGKTPAEGVILYVYHTNTEGVYPTKGDEMEWGKRHGYIRTWLKTDKDGKYIFYTHKPGSYGKNSAHIHATILEPNGHYYYIDDYRFKSDSLLSPNANYPQRGGEGIVEIQKSNTEIYSVTRDIILGLNIPDYNK